MSTIKSNHNPNSDESLANLEYNKKLVKDLKNKILDFIAIETNITTDKNNEMKIIFAGNAVIRVISEVIEVTLDDQGEAWDTKNKPKHSSL